MVPYDLRNNIEAELVVFFWPTSGAILYYCGHMLLLQKFLFFGASRNHGPLPGGGSVKLKEEIDIKRENSVNVTLKEEI
jgi:hypothetical protein